MIACVDNVCIRDVLRIWRLYVVNDLLYHLISARQFGRYLKAADKTLDGLLVKDVMNDYTPCVTDVMLKKQACVLLVQKEEERTNSLVEVLKQDDAVALCLPDDFGTLYEEISWKSSIGRTGGMSEEAVAEQSLALDMCVHAVDKYMYPSCYDVKFPCLVGRSGSGESHISNLVVASQ